MKMLKKAESKQQKNFFSVPPTKNKILFDLDLVENKEKRRKVQKCKFLTNALQMLKMFLFFYFPTCSAWIFYFCF